MTRAASTALAAVLIVAGVFALLHAGWYRNAQIVDYGLYQQYGHAIVHAHQVPYRDFRLEYPPAALPVFALPELLAPHHYNGVFQVLMAVCAAAAVLAVAGVAGRVAALAATLAPLALGSVVLSRFDLWPAALAVLALAALVRNRLTIGAVLLGTAFAAKLWPAVLVPLAIVWIARTHGGRAARAWTVAAVATAAAWFVPFAILSPAGVGHSFHQQLARPLQIESLAGAVLIAVHRTAGTSLHVVTSFGSQNLAGTGADLAARTTTGLELVAIVVVWLLFAGGPATTERLVTSSAAAVAALLAFGKVFSPQFLIWLIPLVPLARRRTAVALPLFGAALVLTQLWFPQHYWEIVDGFQSPYVWYLLARGLAVVALTAALAWPRLQHEVLGEHRTRLEALERVGAQIQ